MRKHITQRSRPRDEDGFFAILAHFKIVKLGLTYFDKMHICNYLQFMVKYTLLLFSKLSN